MTDDDLFISGARERRRAEMDDRTLRAAAGFRSLGVEPGDAVALLLRNDFTFLEASFAATALGAYACPINWHLAAPEVAYVIEDAAARVLVAHDDLLNAVPEAVAAAARAGVAVIAVPTPAECRAAYGLAEEVCQAPAGVPVWNDWLGNFEPLAELADAVTETMYYTSGTTGLPKGVRRFPQSREAAATFGRVRDWVYGIEPGVHALIAGPLYHSAPNSFGLRAATQASRMVLMPRYSSEGFLRLVEEHRITNAFMVPTMFVRLLKLPEEVRARYDVSSLRHIMIAAAPCPAEIKRRMIDWWGPVIHEFYGATELGYMTVCNSAETLERPGTVGRAVDGVTVKALDADGNEVPAGVPGELYGRMAQFPDFTYNNRPDDRAAVERDGLITCGDVGYFDDDGYLFLCDRTREMVISGGVNIYPAEIEAVLVDMPGVRDCAVFGIPDDEFGERLMAIVQPQPGGGAGLDADAITAYLRDRLAGYKIPREIEFRPELPRDDSGKIYKRRLREPYWAGRERRI
ncbi:MAG: acyl-CoA synthetase [Magnetovibrio sp.]|nr:acyl-CoA synthetase [Magnetovibrio sp.]